MIYSRVCMSACLFVCPRSKRKTAWSINTKLGTHILYSSRSAYIDPEVKRSKVKVTGGINCTRRGYACRFDCLCFLVYCRFTTRKYVCELVEVFVYKTFTVTDEVIEYLFSLLVFANLKAGYSDFWSFKIKYIIKYRYVLVIQKKILWKIIFAY